MPSPNVYVVYSGSDAAGADFANSVQRHIQAAGDLVLVGAMSDATLELYITSMDMDPAQPGIASAVSVTYVEAQDSRFITTQVFPVMAAQVENMAASETNSIEQLMEQLK
jgi:hypothetical protein